MAVHQARVAGMADAGGDVVWGAAGQVWFIWQTCLD